MSFSVEISGIQKILVATDAKITHKLKKDCIILNLTLLLNLGFFLIVTRRL